MAKGHHGSVLSRDDFSAMADIAHEEGVFEKSESTIIKNLFVLTKFGKGCNDPTSGNEDSFRKENCSTFFEENPKMRFSRIPVYGEKVDHIDGFVLKDNILEEMVNENGEIRTLSEIRREILVTKSNYAQYHRLFDTSYRQTRAHCTW